MLHNTEQQNWIPESPIGGELALVPPELFDLFGA
jgi:hypothetical protein